VKRECIDCAKLPEGERPREWRPIDKRSGPRTPRCYTHMTIFLTAQKVRQAARKAEQRYGLTPDDEAELLFEQAGLCPCGNKVKDRDHDHELAQAHDHPRERACKACMRGLLCASCNRHILGRGYDSTRLRALADYLDDPPARRLWKDVS
jgi:hypothetical protein